jgi:hypothetical protein
MCKGVPAYESDMRARERATLTQSIYQRHDAHVITFPSHRVYFVYTILLYTRMTGYEWCVVGVVQLQIARSEQAAQPDRQDY